MKTTGQSKRSYRAGPYTLDGRTREILKNGSRMPLSGAEFEVLYEVVERRGQTILRDEFTSCAPRGYDDRRHPVDQHVSRINKKLEVKIVLSERGKGYKLSPQFPVEIIAGPSLSELERELEVALDQINDHTAASFRAAIGNCESLLQKGKVAEAYAVLGLAFINQGHVGFCREPAAVANSKARKVLEEALDLFPTFSSAYALRGLASMIYDYNWSAAEADLCKALELNSDNELAHCFLSHLMVAQRRFDEALDHAHIAAELDYGSSMRVATEPWMMLFAGKVGEAVVQGEKVTKRFSHSGPAHIILGHALRAAGAHSKAAEQYKQALDIEFHAEAHASLGFIHAQAGRRKQALACLEPIRKAKEAGTIAYISSYFEAVVYAGLGENILSLDALDRAFEEQCDWLIHLAVEPRWNALRGERRFATLLNRVGLRRKSKRDR